MQLETRENFGWPGDVNAPSASCRNGTVVHYDSYNQGLAKKEHSACRAYWRNTRKFHMQTRGWNDIGYSFAVCPHGIAMEGRGYGVAQAAQPGGNMTWTSVTFMSGPDEEPTKRQIEAYRELRSWLRLKHNVGSAERPHMDFTSTDCPGPILTPLVRSGKLRATVKPERPATPGTTAPKFPLPKGHWYGPASSNPSNHSGYWPADRPNIETLQDRIKKRGWDVVVNGKYNEPFAVTIRKFQAQKGLKVDGLTGEKTWRAAWEAPIT